MMDEEGSRGDCSATTTQAAHSAVQMLTPQI